MYKSSTTSRGVWPCMYQAVNSLSATQCATHTITCFVPSDVKVCVDQTGGNGTTITVWVDSFTELVCFDATYRANTSVYEKTTMQRRPESMS